MHGSSTPTALRRLRVHIQLFSVLNSRVCNRVLIFLVHVRLPTRANIIQAFGFCGFLIGLQQMWEQVVNGWRAVTTQNYSTYQCILDMNILASFGQPQEGSPSLHKIRVPQLSSAL